MVNFVHKLFHLACATTDHDAAGITLCKEPKLKEFQFKFIHRIIVTKRELFRYGIQSDDCIYCGEKDSIDHTFTDCAFVKKSSNFFACSFPRSSSSPDSLKNSIQSMDRTFYKYIVYQLHVCLDRDRHLVVVGRLEFPSDP